jgi:SulP family sulfate permease
MTMDRLEGQRPFEDSPSLFAVLKSPDVVTREVLAGVVTALALIPEVISFSFISE